MTGRPVFHILDYNISSNFTIIFINYYIILCCVVLCCVVLCYVLLCCVVIE